MGETFFGVLKGMNEGNAKFGVDVGSIVAGNIGRRSDDYGVGS